MHLKKTWLPTSFPTICLFDWWYRHCCRTYIHRRRERDEDSVKTSRRERRRQKTEERKMTVKTIDDVTWSLPRARCIQSLHYIPAIEDTRFLISRNINVIIEIVLKSHTTYMYIHVVCHINIYVVIKNTVNNLRIFNYYHRIISWKWIMKKPVLRK